MKLMGTPRVIGFRVWKKEDFLIITGRRLWLYATAFFDHQFSSRAEMKENKLRQLPQLFFIKQQTAGTSIIRRTPRHVSVGRI